MYPTMKKFRKYLIKRELPITEKVTNQKTNGLTGVNILVKGSALGTTTDSQGNYSSSVPGPWIMSPR